MGAHMRTMAACLVDAERDVRAAFPHPIRASNMLFELLMWQRAKACLDQREAMCIPDDKTADELSRIEYDARRAACAACEAVGLIPEMMGELKL